MQGLSGPEDVTYVTFRLIGVGVASILLERQKLLAKDVSAAIFWVESSERGTYVVAKSMEDGTVSSLKAERGMPFGTPQDAPLSDVQMDLVEQLAERYRV